MKSKSLALIQPEWAHLVDAWQQKGRTGLSLPFLCVATGIQPDHLLNEIYTVGAKIDYCFDILAPIVYYFHKLYRYDCYNCFKRHYWPPDPRRGGRWISEEACNAIRYYLYNASNNPYGYEFEGEEENQENDDDVSIGEISAYIYGTLLERGKVQFKFKESDKKFIMSTIGHPPFQVDGVTRNGDIEYVADWNRKDRKELPTPTIIT